MRSFNQQGFQQGSNQTTYAQQSSPIPIDSQRQQQHSPLHHQSYPNNQISAEKLMSYRNVNTASPANLSSSQGNLSKVSIAWWNAIWNDLLMTMFLNCRATNQVRTIDRVLARVPTIYPPTLTPTLVHRAVPHQLVIMGEWHETNLRFHDMIFWYMMNNVIFRQFETFPVDSYYVNQSFQQNFENFSLVSIYSKHL